MKITASHIKLATAALVLCSAMLLTTQISAEDQAQLQQWLEQLGWWGLLIILLGIIIITPFGLPVTPFIIIASALYSPWLAFPVAMLGQAISALISFSISRHWLRPEFTRWLGHRPLVTRMNHLIDRFGELTVLIMRVSLIFPFTLTNYALGLSTIKLQTFFIWTVIGIAPATLFYAIGTGAIKELIIDGNISLENGMAFAFSAILLISAIVTARHMMKKRQNTQPTTEQT